MYIHMWHTCTLYTSLQCMVVILVRPKHCLDSFTESFLQSSGRHEIFLLLKLCKGTVSDIWKIMEVPNDRLGPELIATEAFSILYLNQPITNRWVRVLYPADSTTATRLWRCNSLVIAAITTTAKHDTNRTRTQITSTHVNKKGIGCPM